jgi:hypothetical protein
MGSRIAIGPGIETVEPCPCQGAPRAVFPRRSSFNHGVNLDHPPEFCKFLKHAEKYETLFMFIFLLWKYFFLVCSDS